MLWRHDIRSQLHASQMAIDDYDEVDQGDDGDNEDLPNRLRGRLQWPPPLRPQLTWVPSWWLWCHGGWWIGHGIDSGGWWQEQTFALQQGILSRFSPPSHQTCKMESSLQKCSHLSGWSWPTRRGCRVWSRSQERTRIEWLCSKLAPYSTWKPPMQNWPNWILKIFHLSRSSLRMSVLWAKIRLGLPAPALQRPVAGSCVKTFPILS